MGKLTEKNCGKEQVKEVKKTEKAEKLNADIPRLTCDYLEQTLQIA